MAKSVTSFIHDLLFRIDNLESTIKIVKKLNGPCVDYLYEDAKKLRQEVIDFLMKNIDTKKVEDSTNIIKHFMERC